jgi:hypothetical protein
VAPHGTLANVSPTTEIVNDVVRRCYAIEVVEVKWGVFPAHSGGLCQGSATSVYGLIHASALSSKRTKAGCWKSSGEPSVV